MIVKKKPCIYKNNSSSRMINAVFQVWLFNLNARMGVLNRKIIMFLDKCSSHKLPDTHRLANVKRFYKLVSFLLREMSCKNHISSLKWNILQAMHWICQAWNSISSTTIKNASRKQGFLFHGKQILLVRMFQKSQKISTTLNCREVSFEDFVVCDKALAICSSSEDQSGTSNTTSTVEKGTTQEPEDDKSTPGTEDKHEQLPGIAEVNSALKPLENHQILSDDAEENMAIFNQLVGAVQAELRKKCMQ
ncbi:hypothetical protein PR048_012071 [Dryococelus australis]|uniref:DDE-1 domain-containing protein n=1 Tax=Dryococelus australis TaxID=614101 RepID=A0ABQ9HNW1_9NEOP|nr:hypothetical protein PR048_012071 [Dryococelus australis]